ncbi:uncharacterized protein NECHADRAFT_78354 [Fusarium vanettenii 77-13-4]|uniref:Uncharacterized protein n=1 Tax=Fusarium vanettenii (strain ATCC MYA-4622 / CBS 123669 / FGSC 9596 / NRRL 45880 / 77-13-4) TaxID=660122 RepID=C7ZFK4_FUSV7|nr:uncharacterized protein NECHADRAFT_78354 [Fusarium vanettenii 77-13-4]EEU37258.1 predicted protein [Fusarium vanettenii 77-13-4]
MSHRVTRSSAKEDCQNKSLHGQAPSSSGIGQATFGGSTDLTPPWSPRDQGRDNQEDRKGTSVSQTPPKPHPADAKRSSAPRAPSISSNDLTRRLTMARAPWATGSVSPTPSPDDDIPPTPEIPAMTAFTREMQHYGKDANNFYDDADTDRTADYPTTPSESSSGFSSVCSSQSSRRSRGDTPAGSIHCSNLSPIFYGYKHISQRKARLCYQFYKTWLQGSDSTSHQHQHHESYLPIFYINNIYLKLEKSRISTDHYVAMITLAFILLIFLYFLLYREMRAESTKKTLSGNRPRGTKRKRGNRHRRHQPFSSANTEPVASERRASETKSKKPGNQDEQERSTARSFRTYSHDTLTDYDAYYEDLHRVVPEGKEDDESLYRALHGGDI